MPPYFLYDILPERWADWCCEHPENLTWVFSGMSLMLSLAVLWRTA